VIININPSHDNLITMERENDIILQNVYLCNENNSPKLNHLVDIYPNSKYLQMFTIFMDVKTGNIKQAETSLNKIKNISTKSCFYYLNYALINLYNGNIKVGESLLKKALSYNDSNEKKWLYFELFLYYEYEQFHIAKDYLEKTLNIDLTFIPAIIEITSMIDFYKRPKEIIETLNKVERKIECPNIILFNSLAQSYLVLNKWKISKEYFLKSIESEPNATAFYGIGMIYHIYSFNFSKSKKYYLLALRFDPYYFEARVANLNLLYENNHIKLFIDFLNESISLENQSLEHLFDLIILLINLKEFTLTSNVISMIISQNPQLDNNLFNLIINSYKNGENEKYIIDKLIKIKNEEIIMLYKSFIGYLWRG